MDIEAHTVEMTDKMPTHCNACAKVIQTSTCTMIRVRSSYVYICGRCTLTLIKDLVAGLGGT